MSVSVRVQLPDRPGALADVAGALARCGSTIERLTVLEAEAGRVVDDLVVSWPDRRSLSALRPALETCQGVRVLGLRSGGDVGHGRAVEVLGQVLRDPARALETTVDALPSLVGAEWAAAWCSAPPYGARYVTPGAPTKLPDLSQLTRPTPLLVGVDALGWLPLSGTTLAFLVGRRDGPPFRRTELEETGQVLGLAQAVAERLAGAAAESLTAEVLRSSLVRLPSQAREGGRAPAALT